MSYTPGPWRVNESKISGKDNISDLTEIVGPQRNGAQRLIAKMYGCALPEGQANARLIAAAPELYEMLSEVLSSIERVACGGENAVRFRAEWVEDAKAALAKAREGVGEKSE